MTDRPTFKPGDLVERTGESALYVYKGKTYTVRFVTDRGYLRLLNDGQHVDGEYRAAGFRLVGEE